MPTEVQNLDRLDPSGRDPDEEVVALVEALNDDADQMYEAANQLYYEDLRYALKLDHWSYDQVDRETGAEMLVGPELFDQLRHNTAVLANVELNTECYPTDSLDTDEACLGAKRALESDILNPRKTFRPVLRRAVLGMLAGGRGVGKAMWDGRTQEIVFGNVSPPKFKLAPGWNDLHDLTCPYVIEELDMRYSDLLAKQSEGWNVAGLEPDGMDSSGAASDTVADGRIPDIDAGGNMHMVRFDMPHTRRNKVLMLWLRFDDTVDATGDAYELNPDEQLMSCRACGHVAEDHPRGWGSGSMIAQDGLSDDVPDGHLPDIGDTCPGCGQGNLEREAVVEEEAAYLRYPDGRLMIVAIYQRKVLYDGAWPCKMPSFPYFQLKCNEHPEDPWGLNETQLHRSYQGASDMLLNSAFQQAISNVDMLIAMENTLKDPEGEDFQFTNAHKPIAYVTEAAGLESVKHFQGSGISPGVLELATLLHGRFQEAKGTNDVSIGPEDTKNIPVGTIRTMARLAEIPMENQRQMIYEALGPWMGCINAMQIHYWTDERKIRVVGPDGAIGWLQLTGDDIPFVEVVIGGPPKFDEARIANLDMLDRLLAYEGNPAAQETAAALSGGTNVLRQYLSSQMRYANMGYAPTGAPPQQGATGKPPGAPGSPTNRAFGGANAQRQRTAEPSLN